MAPPPRRPSPYANNLRLCFNPRSRLYRSRLPVAGAADFFLTWRYTQPQGRKKPTFPARSLRVATSYTLKGLATVPCTLTHTSCFLSSWMALAFARDWEMQTVRTRLKADRTPVQSPLRSQSSSSGLTPPQVSVFKTEPCLVARAGLKLIL